MRPSSALPNKEMAWLVVPLVIAPIAYAIEISVPLLLDARYLPNAQQVYEAVIGGYIAFVIAAIPAYVLGVPVVALLERLRLTGYIAFGIAGAVTAGLFIAALVFASDPDHFVGHFDDVKVYGLPVLGAFNGALFALLLRWVAGWRRRLPVLSDYELADSR